MSEEKPPEKSSQWKDWSWKILLAILVPIGALVSKDIYDYAKTTVNPTLPNPPAVQKQGEKQPDPAKLVGSGAVLDKFGQIVSQLPGPRPGAESADEKRIPVPLIIAARNGRSIAVELLINQGADVNARDKSNGATALIVAAREGHLQIVDLLVKKGADVNASDSSGNTALSEALRHQRTEVANLLKAQGAK
jgi:hypothetical protein